MSKLIAVDLDDVVHNTVEDILKYHNTTYGTQVTLDQYYGATTRPAETWSAKDDETAIRQVQSYVYTEQYLQSKPDLITKEVLNGLALKHRLIIVTGRADFVIEPTKVWIEKNLPNVFADIIHTNFYRSAVDAKVAKKVDICRSLGVDVLIDDHLEHVLTTASGGIDCILFGNYVWNQIDDTTLPANVRRCLNWGDVYEYFDESNRC